MSFTVTKVNNDLVVAVHGETDIELFKTLVNRAMSTWDRAHPRVKTMADEVVHGHALQDYSAQYFGADK